MRALGLKVDISKCQTLKLGRNVGYVDYSIPLIPSQQIRDLGVGIDSSLRYSSHIQKIAASATRVMYCLLRNTQTTEVSVLIRLYSAYVLSILETVVVYGTPLLKKRSESWKKSKNPSQESFFTVHFRTGATLKPCLITKLDWKF